MIKIERINSNEVRVYFNITLPSRRTRSEYIRVSFLEYEENVYINIPACGDIQVQDIPEFTKATELAALIASGELEIE